MTFEIALFQNGQMITDASVNYVSFRISRSDGSAILADSTNVLNATLTAAQWRAGAAALATINLSGADTAALPAEECFLKIEGNTVTASLTESAYLQAGFMVADHTPVIAFTSPTSPSTYYAKTESDARYALAIDVTSLSSRLVTQETKNPVLYSVQTKTSALKAIARANIGAAAVGVNIGTIPSSALDVASVDMWFETLTAATTLTKTGTESRNQNYVVSLAQDATGGWNITWPSGWITAPDAIINPKPSATSQFRVLAHRTAADAAAVYVEPLRTTKAGCEPCFRFDLRQRARATVTAGNLISATDPLSGLTSTTQTATQAFTANAIGGPAITLTGSAFLWFGSTATPTIMEASAPTNSGVTLAIVFTSATASDTCLAHLGPLGLGLYQRGGNLEFGSATSTAARCAVPFTPNDSTATLAIFTFFPGGGCSGYLVRNGQRHKVAYNASAAVGTATTNYELFQTQGGTARHIGKVAHVAVYDRALQWNQLTQLAATLQADFAIA